LRLKAAPGTTGTATVTVTAMDSEGKSTTRTFNVTVQADTFNGGPFLADIPQVRTARNTPTTFQLQGRDVEGDAITYTAQLPTGATSFNFNVNAATGAVSVTPPSNFTGTLQLLVGARPQGTSDTGDLSDMQLVNIEVFGDAPTGLDLLPATDTGNATDDNITNANQLQFQVSGVQSGATVQIFRGTELVGSATATGATVTVTTNNTSPFPEGAHQFTAKQVIGGAASSASPALSVTIDRTAPPAISSTPPTDATVGNLYSYNAQNPQETTPGVFYSLINAPAGMTINQSTGVVNWTPTTSQAGQANFSVRARDAAGNSVDQAVTLNVTVGPGRADQYSTNEDTALTVNAANGVLANDDPDNTLGDPLTATLVANAQHGTVTLNSNGSFTYTPAANFQGTDTFTYRAVRGSQQSNVATVTITVNNTPDTPTAVNDTYSATEDQPLTVNATDGVQKNDQNPDGVTLTSAVVTGPAHGAVTLNANGSFVYTPAADFHGTDSFTYRLTSSSGNSNTATVTLNVAQQNDPPVANNDTYEAVEDTPLTVAAADGVLKNDTDPESGTLVGLLVSNPQHGTVNFNAQTGGFTYTPAANFHGTDTFTYRASDNNSNSTNIATVTLNVVGRNDAPSVQSLTFNSFKNAPRTFFPLADFRDRITDPDGPNQTFRVTAVANASQQGTVEVAPDGSGFFYTPKADFFGPETFTVTVSDQGDLSGSGTATVTVQQFKPGSIAGMVYVDNDNDGVADADEGRVAGITLTLTGTTSTGTAITARTVVTKADGSYKFDNVAPGTYTVAQTQPGLLVDGKETAGSQGNTTSTNDQIAITVAEGTDRTGNNFAEMRPTATFSILDFLADKPEGWVLVAANSTTDSPYYIVETGWQNLVDLDVRLNGNNTAATINVEETGGDKFRAENVTRFQQLANGNPIGLYRILADRSKLTFQPVTSSTTQSTSDMQSLTQDQNQTEQDTQDESQDDNQAEGEFDAALTSQFDVSTHEFSILDFLHTADASASSSVSRSAAAEEELQTAQAVDTVFTSLAEGEEEAPVRQVAAASLTDEEDFHNAVDAVFQQDAAL
jgi:VCBS repeat-containing protein